jgi:hypothetical protein
MRFAVGEGGRAADFAPVRGDPAELPEAGDRRPDLAFKRDIEYLPLFHLYDGTVHSIVEYIPVFHLYDRTVYPIVGYSLSFPLPSDIEKLRSRKSVAFYT